MTDEPVLTQEIIDYSEKRIQEHVDRVQEFGEVLGIDCLEHDYTKSNDDLLESYHWINWYYHVLNHPELGLDEVPYTSEMALASWTHTKLEPHHPEHWDMNAEYRDSEEDRDDPEATKLVDATLMSDEAIKEMAADWCSVSAEVGDSIYDWIAETVDTRWLFTDEQIGLIYSSVNKIVDYWLSNHEEVWWMIGDDIEEEMS